jgi:hypothetical protein
MKCRLTPSLWMLALLLAFAACKSRKDAQKTPTIRSIPDSVAAAYREDAARLTVRELYRTSQSGEDAAELPKDRVDYYYDLLSRVYWMCMDSASIPDLTGIHTLKRPDLRQVRVVLDKDSPFQENWSKGILLTSNLYLNQLISRHELMIKNYRETPMGPILTLESPNYMNTPELAFLIKNFETVRSAEPEGVSGDGNDITWGTDSKNAMSLKYSIGAINCASDCIQRKYWIFHVLPDSSIRYMGTRGMIPKELEPR